MTSKQLVAVQRGERADYPSLAPFHPQFAYPEYAFGALGQEPNSSYEAVRAVFYLAGLDRERYGTPAWNPLRDLIRPGDTVLLKPNMLAPTHPRDPKGWQYVLTHGSVIRAVADYVWKALEGRGKITVADAPLPEASFDQVCRVLGLHSVRDFLRAQSVNFELVDLRKTERVVKGEVVVSARRLPGDPAGYVKFDLGAASEFVGHAGAGRYYGAEYDAHEVNYHHTGGRHEYELAGTAILCDVFFNLPKLKTHKKVGVTLSLKNLVGVNGNKNFLPHHTDGDPSNGGDQFPGPGLKNASERKVVGLMRRLSMSVPIFGPWVHRRARQIGKRIYGTEHETIRSGNWFGNDTTWRMCLDLNKLVLYGQPNGTLRADEPGQRKRYLSLVDGLIAGQGSGPYDPDPMPAGLLAFGTNPAAVDVVCAYLMGFDPARIPLLWQAFRCEHYALSGGIWRHIECVSNEAAWNGPVGQIHPADTFHFEPHYGWRGHIEQEAFAATELASVL
jgi:uncharacterized protein (DUF362 family)